MSQSERELEMTLIQFCLANATVLNFLDYGDEDRLASSVAAEVYSLLLYLGKVSYEEWKLGPAIGILISIVLINPCCCFLQQHMMFMFLYIDMLNIERFILCVHRPTHKSMYIQFELSLYLYILQV